jgi:hypothetical protein
MMSFARIRLEHELARWSAAGRTPILWWRDDDAREPGPALDRLLRLADGLPLALSVIPDRPLNRLAAHLSRLPNVTVGQHGIDHVNRRPDGQPAGEFSLDMSVTVMAHSIAYGRQRMINCGLAPAFYTPPWNRVDASLPEALAIAGFDLLSAWDSAQIRLDALRRLDAHVDLLRWKGTPHFRGRNHFHADLTQQLARRRRANMMTLPVGILTHHLDHDEAAWSFLGHFIEMARDQFAFGALCDLTTPGAEARGGETDLLLYHPASVIAF